MIGIYLLDKNQNLIKSITPDLLIENTQVMELGGQITARAKFPYKDFEENAEYFGVKEENNFWLYKIRKKQKEGGHITIDGIHIFFDELKGTVVRDIRNQDTPANLVVEKIIAGTGWDLKSNVSKNIASKNFYYQSALSAFYDAVQTWDFEFMPEIIFNDGRIISKKINIYNQMSRDFGKWYEYGDKLVKVVAESSTDELYTAFIGRGKGIPLEDEDGNLSGGFSRKIKFDDIEYTNEKNGVKVHKPKGIDFIEIKEATKLYGYPDGTPRIGVVDFDNIEDEKLLADATFEYALENTRPKLQLRATTIETDPVELGETVSIIRPDMNIRYKVRIFKIQKDFLKEKVVSFEFGDKIVSSAGDRLKAEGYEKRKRNEEIDSYIDGLRDEINSSYFNDSAYNYDLKIGNKYGLPAGYYSFDRPIDENPTKVIYMGAGKMLVADSKNPDGSWKWGTMATGQGVVAESIVGTLGEFAKVNATQINVNADFYKTDIGEKINEGLKIVDDKVVDETGKIRDDLEVVDGKIVDLEGKVVLQNTLYNNVKITPEKGIQVLDAQSRERLQLGNWAPGRYGLNLKDASGNQTILDDQGILQSWQDGRCDNADSNNPLKLHIYIPNETSGIYKAALRIYTEGFRAYSKGTASGGGRPQTTSGGQGGYSTTGSGGYDTRYTEQYKNVDGGMERVYTKTRDGEDYNRWIDIYLVKSHEHYFRVNDHTHRVDINSHTHYVDLPDHFHDIVFGIYQEYASNVRMEVYINGNNRTSAVSGKSYIYGRNDELNLTKYLDTGWNEIEIKTNQRCRIDATIFIQALLNYGGY